MRLGTRERLSEIKFHGYLIRGHTEEPMALTEYRHRSTSNQVGADSDSESERGLSILGRSLIYSSGERQVSAIIERSNHQCANPTD
jgi:hypothetical protein